MKKTYILCNSNWEVLNLCKSKKEVKSRINEKIKDELEIYWCVLNWKIQDYEVWSIKYNSKKFYLDLSFYDLFVIDRKTGDPVEYDDYKKYGIIDKKENKDFLYLNSKNMKKENTYTIIDKDDLFDELNNYLFYSFSEIVMAICDYIEKKEWCLYYSDCAFASELASEFVDQKELYDLDYDD